MPTVLPVAWLSLGFVIEEDVERVQCGKNGCRENLHLWSRFVSSANFLSDSGCLVDANRKVHHPHSIGVMVWLKAVLFLSRPRCHTTRSLALSEIVCSSELNILHINDMMLAVRRNRDWYSLAKRCCRDVTHHILLSIWTTTILFFG